MSSPSGHTDMTGQLLGGRYRVTRLVGTGGMGAVYEAVQEDLRRSVAIKLMHPTVALDQALVDRFRIEAQAAAAIGHPNITQVFDFRAVPPEPPFIVMELLSGTSLRDLIAASAPLSPSRVAFIGAQVVSALGAAHARGIVHRDIKPANVFICSGSAVADLAKVLDFGVAKLAGSEGPESVQGVVVGTMDYMAPEQARGETVDARADLYSVGAMLYHALAGKKPLTGSDVGSRLRAILFESPVPLASHRPDVPPELCHAIERAMEKDVSRRFSCADEMQAALMGVLPGAASRATTPSPSTAPPSTLRAPDTVRDTAGTAPAWMVQTMVSPVAAIVPRAASAPVASGAPIAPGAQVAPTLRAAPGAALPLLMARPTARGTSSSLPVPLVVLFVLGAVFFFLVLPVFVLVWRTATVAPPIPPRVFVPTAVEGPSNVQLTAMVVGSGVDVNGDGVEDLATIGLEPLTRKFHVVAVSGSGFAPLWMSPPLESRGGRALTFLEDVLVLGDFENGTLYAFDARTGAARGKRVVEGDITDQYESPTSPGVLCLTMGKAVPLQLTAAVLNEPAPSNPSFCPPRVLPWSAFVKLGTLSDVPAEGDLAVAISRNESVTGSRLLVGFDVPSLKRTWTRPLPSSVNGMDEPFVAAGLVFVEAPEKHDERVLVFDLATGAPRFELGGGVEIRAATAKRIYATHGVVVDGPVITVFDARTGTRLGDVNARVSPGDLER